MCRREGTEACEDASRQVGMGPVSSRRHMGTRRHSPKTLPGDRSGWDLCRREDTWAREDTSRRQVGMGHVSSQGHMGVRSHFPKIGRSGEGTRRRKDTWAREDTSRRQVGRTQRSRLGFLGGWRLQSFGEGEGNSRRGFRGREIVRANLPGTPASPRHRYAVFGDHLFSPEVRGPGVVGECGVRTLRQGTTWRSRTCCQDMVSEPHVASRRHVASVDLAVPPGVRRTGRAKERRCRGRHLSAPDLASECVVNSSRGFSEGRGVAGRGVAGVASGAVDRSGVT